MKIPLQTKAILFDMDGVIFNTEDLAHDVFGSLSHKFGYSFEEDDHRTILGSSQEFWSEYLVNRFKSDLNANEFALLFWSELHKVTNSDLKLMPGVRESIHLFKEHGLILCLVSNSPRTYIEDLLGTFDLLKMFDCIVASEDTVNGKPSPEPYLKAAELIQVDPSMCVVIEDSINGVRSAKAAGCFALAVPTVHALGLDYHMADIVIHSLNEIEMS